MSPLRNRYTLGFAVTLGLTLAAGAAFRHVKTAGTSTSSRQKTVEPAVTATSATGNTAQARAIASYGKLPLSFEVNRGQAAKEIKFLTRGPGYTLFLTERDAVLSLSTQKSEVSHESGGKSHPPLAPAEKTKVTTEVLRMKLVNATQPAEPTGMNKLPGKVNYFIGNDPSKWHANIPTYAKVCYKNVYPGIDLVYYGNQGQLEYDFVVSPGADPGLIALSFEGRTGLQRRAPLRIDKSGDVIVESRSSNLRVKKPVIYQPRDSIAAANSEFPAQDSKSVDGRFVLTSSNQIHFELGPYDKSQPLVIDPALVYSTFLGGTVAGSFSGGGIGAIDSSGNLFLVGGASSNGFPTTANVLNPTSPASGGAAYVAKINATGTALIYSTYFGASSGETGFCGENGPFLAIDSLGNVYLTGYTTSTVFPVTTGAFQTTIGNSQECNAFVTKLNTSGSKLVYSTYLGGTNGMDVGHAIAVDSAGHAYVAGQAGSTDFPTLSALQPTFGGGQSDAFLTELSADGSKLIFSTFLGGSGNDYGALLAIDGTGAAYVAGNTASADFPTNNPLQATGSAFLTKFAPGGSSLEYSTYLGGSGPDFPMGLVVDGTGAAYVGGQTESPNFPTTVNAFQASCPSTHACIFATKINPAGSDLIYSTYLGGSGSQGQFGGVFAVDASGNAYLGGVTWATDFPLLNPIQATYGGNADVFVTVLDPTGSKLVFSTYLGGAGRDRGGSEVLDSAGHIWVGGVTESTDFPVTSEAMQTSFAGNSAAFLSKIDLSATAPPSYSLAAGTPTQGSVSPGGSSQATVTVASTNGYTGSVTLSCTVAPVVSPAPTCSFGSTSPVSVTSSGGSATLTFNTVGPSAAATHPRMLYALLLPISGLALIGIRFGSGARRKNRLPSWLLLCFVLAVFITIPACGGGGPPPPPPPPPPPNSGTPAGTYTVTITGKDASGATQTNAAPTVTITVS
jgi:hypothetical protein